MPIFAYKRSEKAFVLVVKRGDSFFEKRFPTIFTADLEFQRLSSANFDCALFIDDDLEPIEENGNEAAEWHINAEPPRRKLVPGNWTIDKTCIKKRNLETCLDCIRFEMGECKMAVSQYEVILGKRRNT